ncbi:MAG: hypothetical protein ACOYXN_03250 [Acidobacteriota bacterium]
MAKKHFMSEEPTPEDERRRDDLLDALERLGVNVDRSPGKPPGIEDALPHRIQDFIQDLQSQDQEELIRRTFGLASLQVAPALGGIFPSALPGATWCEKWQVLQERLSQCPGPEAFAAGVALGWAFGRVAAGILSRKEAGNRSPEDTRTPSIKSKLIAQYLQRQKDASFAAYWGALCEPAAWIKEYLDSWGVLHHGEKDGVVTLWRGSKTLAIRKDSHGRLFRRLKRKSGQMTRIDPPPFGR